MLSYEIKPNSKEKNISLKLNSFNIYVTSQRSVSFVAGKVEFSFKNSRRSFFSRSPLYTYGYFYL